MELAAAGVAVDVYDRNEQCLTQASASNEGKVHLGYVYANDRSLRTAHLMLKGASSFGPLLRRWIGDDIDGVPISSAFDYVIHRNSLLSVDAIARHMRACCDIAREECHGPIDYFGMDFRQRPALMAGHHNSYDGAQVTAVFNTPEIALDPEALADLVRSRLQRIPNIRCVTRAIVTAIAERDSAIEVEFTHSDSSQREGYDHVINAAWDGRLAIDATMGLTPPRPWVYRMKHYVRARLRTPNLLPSCTIVLGAFGDVVSYDGGDVYLSWYPAGLLGWSGDLSVPAWPRSLDESQSAKLLTDIRVGLSGISLGVRSLKPRDLESWSAKGGIIFAWGSSDIDDPSSELHGRAQVGPTHHGRYHSIDTGKLTLAPFFAKQTADYILNRDVQ
jgi:hypothetical protein